MVPFLTTQRIQCPVACVPQVFLVAGLHQRIVDVIAALLRNVQLISQLAYEAYAKDSYITLVKRINLNAQNGGGIRRELSLVAEIEIGYLLDNFSTFWALNGEDAQFFGVVSNVGA